VHVIRARIEDEAVTYQRSTDNISLRSTIQQSQHYRSAVTFMIHYGKFLKYPPWKCASLGWPAWRPSPTDFSPVRRNHRQSWEKEGEDLTGFRPLSVDEAGHRCRGDVGGHREGKPTRQGCETNSVSFRPVSIESTWGGLYSSRQQAAPSQSSDVFLTKPPISKPGQPLPAEYKPARSHLLLVNNVSTALTNDDFLRLLPSGKHMEGWRAQGGLLRGKRSLTLSPR
jgi:hypothetical protein